MRTNIEQDEFTSVTFADKLKNMHLENCTSGQENFTVDTFQLSACR